MEGLKRLSMLMSTASNVLPKGLLSEVQKATDSSQTDDGHQFLYALDRDKTQKFAEFEGLDFQRPHGNSSVIQFLMAYKPVGMAKLTTKCKELK
jgi:hypothetical protein